MKKIVFLSLFALCLPWTLVAQSIDDDLYYTPSKNKEEKKEEEIKKKRPSVREMIFTMIPILFLVYVVIERIKRKREKRNCEGKRKRNRNQKRKCKHYRRKKRKRKKSRRQKRKMQKTAKLENQMRNSSSFDMFSGGSSKEPGVCRNRNRNYRNLY